MTDRRILVARIGRPHGVRGQVKLVSFTAQPRAVASYGPLRDRTGREWRLTRISGEANPLVATIEGIGDRDAALRLTNLELFVERSLLPAPEEDEFYLADLEGLDAYDTDGARLGRVRAVHDYGGGAWLEIEGETDDWSIPFTRHAVPEVDVAAGRITVALPDEIEWQDEDEADPDDPDDAAQAPEGPGKGRPH